VLPVELFFDLVYVLAVTQLTHYLLDHLTLRGAAEALLLFLAVWRGWVHITWVSNYFDVRSRQFRLVLMLVTFASLIVSASLPQAFDGRGVAFAVGFGVILTSAAGWAVIALGRDHPLKAPFERALAWDLVIALLFLLGGILEGDARFVIWLGAIGMAYAVMWLGFPFAMLGALLAADPKIRDSLIALGARHQLKHRHATEVAAEIFIGLFEHARSIAEGKPSKGPFEQLLRPNVQSTIHDRRTIEEIAALAAQLKAIPPRISRNRPTNNQNPRTPAPQNQSADTEQAPKPND